MSRLRFRRRLVISKFSVVDDGIGISAKDLPRVFERFFQVETHLTRHYGGMGLGLAVAKAMIELHDGRIWVESEEGKGSTFIFLPFQQSRPNLLPSRQIHLLSNYRFPGFHLKG